MLNFPSKPKGLMYKGLGIFLNSQPDIMPSISAVSRPFRSYVNMTLQC